MCRHATPLRREGIVEFLGMPKHKALNLFTCGPMALLLMFIMNQPHGFEYFLHSIKIKSYKIFFLFFSFSFHIIEIIEYCASLLLNLVASF